MDPEHTFRAIVFGIVKQYGENNVITVNAYHNIPAPEDGKLLFRWDLTPGGDILLTALEGDDAVRFAEESLPEEESDD